MYFNSRESSLLKRVQYNHSRNMKRNSKKRLCGAITKRTVRKVPICNLPTVCEFHIEMKYGNEKCVFII
jgi:hypothetical protein